MNVLVRWIDALLCQHSLATLVVTLLSTTQLELLFDPILRLHLKTTLPPRLARHLLHHLAQPQTSNESLHVLDYLLLDLAFPPTLSLRQSLPLEH